MKTSPPSADRAGPLVTVLCLLAFGLVPPACQDESKPVEVSESTENDSDKTDNTGTDTDTSSNRVTTVVDWNDNGRDFCDELHGKLLSCDLVALGLFGCIGPSDPRDACFYECIFAASCEEVSAIVCGPFSESPLERCADDCYEFDSFTCADGADRINASWRCDGEPDCSDGSDESGCADFECADGGSVPAARRCDQYIDCDDGSDETDCPLFGCDNGDVVPDTWQCDYFADCADGSDERNCPGFLCGSGEVVNIMWVCDYYPDCDDGSDEIGCTGFQCDDGQITAAAWRCDDYEDCDDGSDETNCTGFDCGSGEVIPANWECDREPDCLDASDEHAACAQILCEP